MNCLESTKDMVTILAGCTAIYVGLAGLNAWKKQLRGKTEYELARRYLMSVYKIRESFEDFRNIAMTTSEINKALKEGGYPENYNNTNTAVYTYRWKKVSEAWTNLFVELIEAEVFWGKEAKDIIKDLVDNRNKLQLSFYHYINNRPYKDEEDILFDSGENDNFNISVNLSISKIEDYLRKHLK
jgi:hypothetical protein